MTSSTAPDVEHGGGAGMYLADQAGNERGFGIVVLFLLVEQIIELRRSLIGTLRFAHPSAGMHGHHSRTRL